MHHRFTDTDWPPPKIGDAFRAGEQFARKRSAHLMFQRRLKAAQRSIAQLTGEPEEIACSRKLKIQYGPCYTDMPMTFAAESALGLTSYLEFDSRIDSQPIVEALESFIKDPTVELGPDAASSEFKSIVERAAKSVQTVVFLDELRQVPELYNTELYRLFAASFANPSTATLRELVHASILFPEVLPQPSELYEHPQVSKLFSELTIVSAKFRKRLDLAEESMKVAIASQWVIESCRRVVSAVVRLEADRDTKQNGSGAEKRASREIQSLQTPLALGSKKSDLREILNLESPDRESSEESVVLDSIRDLVGGDYAQRTKSYRIDRFVEAINDSIGETSIGPGRLRASVTTELNDAPFEYSEIESSFMELQQVSSPGGLDRSEKRYIYETLAELEESSTEGDLLLARALPLARELERMVYPTSELHVEFESHRRSGHINSGRLALHLVSDVIFDRANTVLHSSIGNRATLLIACDASASLGKKQILMVKTLSAAYAFACNKMSVRLLTGFYHSGPIGSEDNEPLIRWVTHFEKLPLTSKVQAINAIATIPNKGTGAQLDALSLKRMAEEARRLSGNDKVFITIITDCAWNKSFPGDHTAEDEILALFKEWKNSARCSPNGAPSVTLVSVGDRPVKEIENLVDKVIELPSNDSTSAESAATIIGKHVASCIRNSKTFMGKP